MLIGYELSGPDNGGHMTGSTDRLDEDLPFLPKCNVCGYRTDYRYTDLGFKLPRKVYDLSYTYDGNAIVSLQFKEFISRNGYPHVHFAELPKAPGFFHFYVEGDMIPYLARAEDGWCQSCQQYYSVIGPVLNLKSIAGMLKDGIYRSDRLFASGNAKGPTLIVGCETRDKMKVEKLKGLTFHPIEK